MPDVLSALLSPVTHSVAAVLAATHDAAGAVGLSPGSAGAWLLAVLLLVVAVRTVLLPVTVHQVRSSHARAHAAPQLRELRRRYAGIRDLEQLTAMRTEQKAIHAEHGVSGWSLAPALLQLPLFYALYRVVSDLTAGHSVGALDAGLVASASAASLAGLHLTSHLGATLASNPLAGVVLVTAALGAALLSLLSQRWFVLPMTDVADLPEGMATVQRLMPWLGAVGVLAAAAFVPAGLIAYWLFNNAWTFAQQGLVWRFAPTPGSPAAARREARALEGAVS
ncbi:membrane protein insertase YidC [Terrabacter carboxydivorans]|uniref:Membrane protein insertase YidC n=1 Tax=Terrabacter carboxydivorans TaxID=619730 RepID=A0ABP5XXS3_9MICO